MSKSTSNLISVIITTKMINTKFLILFILMNWLIYCNILSNNDVFFFTEKFSKSNFVGSGDITGNIIHIDKITNTKFDNKIVCITSADPGYDYIFSKKIKGLITMFGGINSHMAIRCSELGIPAAIGVGERLFKEIVNSKTIRLNTVTEKIDIIS